MAKSFATLVVALMSVATFAQATGRSGGQTTPQAPAKPQAPLDKALAPMQGTWVVTDFNGEAPASMLIAIKGDKYEVIVKDAVTERGTISPRVSAVMSTSFQRLRVLILRPTTLEPPPS